MPAPATSAHSLTRFVTSYAVNAALTSPHHSPSAKGSQRASPAEALVSSTRESYPDPTAFDADSAYYDPKSDPENPRWFVVDVKLKKKFERAVTLKALKTQSVLGTMRLLQRGNRLSVMPLSQGEYLAVLALATAD